MKFEQNHTFRAVTSSQRIGVGGGDGGRKARSCTKLAKKRAKTHSRPEAAASSDGEMSMKKGLGPGEGNGGDRRSLSDLSSSGFEGIPASPAFPGD